MESFSITRKAAVKQDYGFFAVAARGIYFLDRKSRPTATIRLLNPATGAISTVAELAQSPIFETRAYVAPGMTISPDGRWVVYPYYDPREQRPADIMLVENFR